MKPTETTDTQGQEKKRSGGKIVTKRTPENIKPGEKIITKRKAAPGGIRKRKKTRLKDYKLRGFDIEEFRNTSQLHLFEPESIDIPSIPFYDELIDRGDKETLIDLRAEQDFSVMFSSEGILTYLQIDRVNYALDQMGIDFYRTTPGKNFLNLRHYLYYLLYAKEKIELIKNSIKTLIREKALSRFINNQINTDREKYIDFITAYDVTADDLLSIESELSEKMQKLREDIAELRNTLLVFGKALERGDMLYLTLWNLIIRYWNAANIPGEPTFMDSLKAAEPFNPIVTIDKGFRDMVNRLYDGYLRDIKLYDSHTITQYAEGVVFLRDNQ